MRNCGQRLCEQVIVEGESFLSENVWALRGTDSKSHAGGAPQCENPAFEQTYSEPFLVLADN